MALLRGKDVADDVNEKIYVAVSKEWKAWKSNLEWVVRNSKGKTLCFVHVHEPAQYISLFGAKFPTSSLSEPEVMAHREKERQDICKILDEYIRICTKAGVQVEKLYIEKETVESGLVELISQHKIERLVMGAAADKSYSRKMMEPKSKKAKYVRQYAPVFCHIWFICKGRLICKREGIKQSRLDDEDQNGQANTKSRLSQYTSEWSTATSKVDFVESLDRSSTFSLSQLSVFYRCSEAATDSTFYHSGTEDREPSFRSLTLPLRPEGNQHHLLSLNARQEGNMDGALYNQLDQAIAEAESAKQEAFQESMRCRKAEKDSVEAICKAKAAESLYHEELRRRKELEEELTKAKEKLESTKKERDMALDELRKVMDQKMLPKQAKLRSLLSFGKSRKK